MTIPMEYQGTKLIFKITVPTEREMNVLPHVTLTSKQPWDPGEIMLGKVKAYMNNQEYNNMVKEINIQMGNGCRGITRYESQGNVDNDFKWMHEVNPVVHKLSELGSTKGNYDPKLDDIPNQESFKSIKRHNDISEDVLAEIGASAPSKQDQH